MSAAKTFSEPTYIVEWKPRRFRKCTYKSFHGLDEVAAEVLGEVGSLGRTRSQRLNKETAIVSLIASLHQCVIEGRPLGIHLDSTRYKLIPQLDPGWWTYRTLSRAICLLIETEMVLKRRGFKNPETGEGRITKLYATPRLLNLFKLYAPVAYETSSHQTLVLRNKEKEDMTYTADAFTEQAQSFVDRLNEWLGGFDVQLDGRKLGTECRRMFSRGSWELHGRFYCDIQSFSAVDRERITINGGAVKDVDFTSMHPRMCYARECITPVMIDGDYYLPVLDALGICRCWADYEYMREAVKKIMSTTFNARDEDEARNAFHDKINKAKRGTHTVKKAVWLRIEQALESRNLDFNDLLVALEEVHAPIAKYFNSDAGVTLMNEDSQILIRILKRCMELGIAAIPIHDSVLVPAEKAKNVEMIMEKEFNGFYKD